MAEVEKITLIILWLFFVVAAHAQDEQKLLSSGNELYKKQQFEKAAEQYQKATDINEKNPKAQYNLGNALYKSRKTEAAEKAYNTAADNTSDIAIKSHSLYNKGVTLSRQNKLPESIQAYKQTLRLNPSDEEARENLQKALNELKKQPPPQQPKDEKQKPDKNKKNTPKPEPNNSKLNQKQVEQMLNALRQDEKKIQQDLQKKNVPTGSNSKDW